MTMPKGWQNDQTMSKKENSNEQNEQISSRMNKHVQ